MKFPTVNWSRIGTALYERKYLVGGLVLLVILGGALWRMAASESAPAAENAPREVAVARVADLMNGGASLSVVGEVQSKSEAKISTEAGGRITRVSVALGDRVGAGAVLAEIENGAQRAAVLQAEGALDAAKASAGGARGSALTTVLGAYAAMNSAVEDAVGQILSDPESSQSAFIVSSKDTQALADIERMRPALRPVLERHEAQTASLSASSDLAAELSLLETELRQVRTYLDAVLKALNAGVPRDDITGATISGYISDVTGARTSVTSSLSAVISARTTTEGNGAVSSSQASIKQAEGAYNAALANLEKTRVRAPIGGTVTHFSLKLGDNVSPGTQVAIVSNTGALEVVTSITQEDRSSIAVGAKASIEGGFEGVVTRIAPALDPVTRKIEVRIGLSGDALKELTSGESVRVSIEKRAGGATPNASLIRIPIAALKMGTERSIVFTVDAEGKLAAHEVTVGALSGDYVTITEGLTPETEIVADARGLKEGDTITPVGR